MARGRQKSQGSESGGEGGKEKEDRSNRLILKEETVLNVRTLALSQICELPFRHTMSHLT